MKLDYGIESDRIHILVGNVEYTILKDFILSWDTLTYRGPCYISDVHIGGRQIVDDKGSHHSINTPFCGGLFGFGLVACKPPDDYDFNNYNPSDFWNWGWELTTRLPAEPAGDFGISSILVSKPVRFGQSYVRVKAHCILICLGRTIAQLSWDYKFRSSGLVDCKFTFKSLATFPGLWIKEPKIVCNGLLGMNYMTVNLASGISIPEYDLSQLNDPAKHTKQIPWALRRGATFESQDRSIIMDFQNDQGFFHWLVDRDNQPAMTNKATPPYCLNKSHLISRWEVARLSDKIAFMQHVDEGGYGAPDCLACFRPWPNRGTNYSVNLGVKITG